jgi:flagellar motility protein MotE (MotC chaperone)
MNDVSIDLSAIVEEENDTELLDILNVREKIDEKSLPVKKRKIENVTVENNKIEKHKNDSQNNGLVIVKYNINMKF